MMRLIFKTSSVTPDFFYVFNLILSFSTCSESFEKICAWELLGANVLNKRKSLRVQQLERADIIHSIQIAKLKKFSTLKNHLVHYLRAKKCREEPWFFFPALFPAIAVENPQGISQLSPFLIMQRNIHARTHDTCRKQREYMTSGWRNLF